MKALFVALLTIAATVGASNHLPKLWGSDAQVPSSEPCIVERVVDGALTGSAHQRLVKKTARRTTPNTLTAAAIHQDHALSSSSRTSYEAPAVAHQGRDPRRSVVG